jgi:hypothetical protein
MRIQKIFQEYRREYLNDKINELTMTSKNKDIRDLYRGKSKFNRGYQPKNNFVSHEK